MATGRIPQKRVLGDANATAQRSLTNTKIMQNQNKLDNMQQQLFDMIYPIGIIITTIPEVTLDPQYWKRLGDPVEGFALVSTGADSKTVGTTSGQVIKHTHDFNSDDTFVSSAPTKSRSDGNDVNFTYVSSITYNNVVGKTTTTIDGGSNNLAAGYYVNFWQRI
jgi:hypothetical protein